jgi:hypothetical protein
MINIKVDENHPLGGTGYSSSEHGASLPRHRWYWVKESFSPNMVETAIKDSHVSENDLIIDPFCGSGTVPLTSVSNKIQAVGFEVNPFLAFVARTKLLKTQSKTLNKHIDKVLGSSEKGSTSPLESYSSFSEAGGKDKWLFNRSVLQAFEGGWLSTLNTYNPSKNLLQLCLIRAAMDTCNAVKDGKCLRYRKNWETLNFGKDDFLAKFESHIKNIKDDLDSDIDKENQGTIHLADSRKHIINNTPKKFKLCITSPPYLNSFDYSDVYRPELFLGKFVSSNEDLNLVRHKTLRSHVQVNWKKPKENNFGHLFNETYQKILDRKDHLWSKNIPSMIQAYFEDIERILRSLRSCAERNASLWLVVSTSAYAGVEIPVDLILAHIGSKVGWHLREIGVIRYLRSSGQRWNRWAESDSEKPKLRESVVIMDASINPF